VKAPTLATLIVVTLMITTYNIYSSMVGLENLDLLTLSGNATSPRPIDFTSPLVMFNIMLIIISMFLILRNKRVI